MNRQSVSKAQKLKSSTLLPPTDFGALHAPNIDKNEIFTNIFYLHMTTDIVYGA